MGLFDNLLGKVTELSDMGQQAVDGLGNAIENLPSQLGETTEQAKEQVSNVTENLPQDPQDIIDKVSGESNKE